MNHPGRSRYPDGLCRIFFKADGASHTKLYWSKKSYNSLVFFIFCFRQSSQKQTITKRKKRPKPITSITELTMANSNNTFVTILNFVSELIECPLSRWISSAFRERTQVFPLPEANEIYLILYARVFFDTPCADLSRPANGAVSAGAGVTEVTEEACRLADRFIIRLVSGEERPS